VCAWARQLQLQVQCPKSQCSVQYHVQCSQSRDNQSQVQCPKSRAVFNITCSAKHRVQCSKPHAVLNIACIVQSHMQCSTSRVIKIARQLKSQVQCPQCALSSFELLVCTVWHATNFAGGIPSYHSFWQATHVFGTDAGCCAQCVLGQSRLGCSSLRALSVVQSVKYMQ